MYTKVSVVWGQQDVVKRINCQKGYLGGELSSKRMTICLFANWSLNGRLQSQELQTFIISVALVKDTKG